MYLLNIQIHIDFVTLYVFFPARKVFTIPSHILQSGKSTALGSSKAEKN